MRATFRRHFSAVTRLALRSMIGGGVFGGSLAHGDIPPGQAVLSELLAECYDLVAAAQQKQQ